LEGLEEENEEWKEHMNTALEWARTICKEYPLLQQSDFIQDVMKNGFNEEALSIKQLENFLLEVSQLRPQCFFHKILMHSELSGTLLYFISIISYFLANDLRRKIKKINKETLNLSKKFKKLIVIVFIDELNTSSVLGLVKEIFVDNTLDGEPLAKNIFYIGCINPFTKRAGKSEEITGQQGNFAFNLAEFVVNELPLSLKKYRIDYDRLDETQEREFLSGLFSTFDFDHHHITSMQGMILKGKEFASPILIYFLAHRFVVNCKIPRVHPSIRDLVRMRDLVYFYCAEGQNILTGVSNGQLLYGALLISVAICYYFRLPTDFKGKDLRKDFCDLIKREMDLLRFPISDFQDFVHKQLCFVFNDIDIPAGIASTQSLLENIYCNIIWYEESLFNGTDFNFSLLHSIQNCIPLQITGPPGSSKTLSFNLVSERMKGKQSTSRVLRRLKNVHRFHYQVCRLFCCIFF